VKLANPVAPERPRRGEVWCVDFSPSVGNEIRDERPAGEAGLPKPSRIKCDQIGKADIRRFRPNGKLGRLRPETLRRVEMILKRLLEL
jgi:mRNA-degrading endonuclease toxin of MazEF toxin-antitoxin module